MLRSGRIQFQSFLMRISFHSSGLRNNLGGLYSIHKIRDYSMVFTILIVVHSIHDATGHSPPLSGR